MSSHLTPALCVAVLAGCATAYQPEGLTGGFDETQLDRNVFRVSFKGNGLYRAGARHRLGLIAVCRTQPCQRLQLLRCH